MVDGGAVTARTRWELVEGVPVGEDVVELDAGLPGRGRWGVGPGGASRR